MSNDWPVPEDAHSYLRQERKRTDMMERRPSVTKASDLMGPGLAPFAVRIDDLDSGVAAFNSMYVIPPGALGSPDDTKWWMGQTIASEADGGVQIISTFMPSDAPHVQMMRGFQYVAGSTTRAYSNWQPMGGGTPPPPMELIYGSDSVTEISPYTLSDITLVKYGKMIYFMAAVRRPTVAPGSGYYNAGRIPAGFRPGLTTALNAGVATVTYTWTPKARVMDDGYIEVAMSSSNNSNNNPMNLTGFWPDPAG